MLAIRDTVDEQMGYYLKIKKDDILVCLRYSSYLADERKPAVPKLGTESRNRQQTGGGLPIGLINTDYPEVRAKA